MYNQTCSEIKDLAESNEEMAVCGLLSSDIPLSWSNIIKFAHWKKTQCFPSTTFYACKNVFHQSSRHWLPETAHELLTLLKPLAFSLAFLYPEILPCFMKPAKMLSFF